MPSHFKKVEPMRIVREDTHEDGVLTATRYVLTIDQGYGIKVVLLKEAEFEELQKLIVNRLTVGELRNLCESDADES